MLRKALIRIRREYNVNLRRLITFTSIISVVGIILALTLDLLAPFSGFWNVVRSLLLIPLSATFFVAGYTFGLFLHKRKKATDKSWVPYRLRFSLMWRRRIAWITGAFLVVFMYATGFSAIYTVMASVFIAIGIAIFAFIRATRDESIREELEIPDIRDLNYETHRKNSEDAREKEKEENKKNKKAGKAEKEEDYEDD